MHENEEEVTRAIFYKIPEQLERHYKTWLQAWGERATLVNTTQMRLPATHLLTDSSRQAHVLPPIPLLQPGLSEDFSAVLYSQDKGKAPEHLPSSSGSSNFMTVSAVVQSTQMLDASVPPRAQTLVQTHEGSLGLSTSAQTPHQKQPQKRQKKQCAACKQAKCPLAKDCSGSGNRKLCNCIHTGRHGPAR